MAFLKIRKISALGFILAYLSFLLISCARESDANDIQKIHSALKQNKFKLAEELCEKYRTAVKSNNCGFNYIYFRTLLQRGKVKKADEFFNRHCRIDTLPSPIIFTDKAIVKYYLGDMDSAGVFARKAIENAGEGYILSRAYNVLGLISFFKGNLDSAAYYQNIAKNFALSDSSILELANALRQLGVIAWYRGDLNKAKTQFYLPALDLYKKCGNKIGEATTLSDIGLLYFDLKNWTKNFEYQLKAMKIRMETGDLIGLADSYYFFGNFPVYVKEITSLKLKFLEKSDSISKAVGYKWGAEIASNSLLTFYNSYSELIYESEIRTDSSLHFSNDAKFIRQLREFQEKTASLPNDELLKLGKKVIKSAEKSGSEAYMFSAYSCYFTPLLKAKRFDEAERVMAEIKNKISSYNSIKYLAILPDIWKSQLFAAQGDYLSAYRILKYITDRFESLYEDTIVKSGGILGFESIISQINSYRTICYSMMFDVLYKLKDWDKFYYFSEREKRFSSYYSANITNGKSDSFVHYLNGILSNDGSKSFNLYADSLSMILNHLEGNILNRAISIDKMNKGSLHKYSASIEKLNEKLNNDETYLSFVSGANNCYILVSNRNKIIVFRLAENYADIKNEIKFFLKTIERGSKYPNDNYWKKPAARLYSLIFSPLEALFDSVKIKSLIISPTGIFYHLPFAALLAPGSEKQRVPLIEKFNIIYCCSALDFISGKEMDFKKPKSILAIAPNAKLIYSQKEVNEIPVSLFQYRKFLLGDNATTLNFIENAGLFDVVHFAGHSKVNGLNPLYSGIEFYDKTLKLIDIYKYKFSPELVILSSCQSGLTSGISSDNPGSLDMFSFVRTLKDIGAKSVISAGWYINDKSGAELMLNFYRYLAKIRNSHLPVSEALKLAQIDMFSSPSISMFSHPFYWAGYSNTQ